MSDLGTLSNNYIKWNSYLNELNDWLLSIRKMKDGLISVPESIKIPGSVRQVLQLVANSLQTTSSRVTSDIPLEIKTKIVQQLGSHTQHASDRISLLLAATPLQLSDFTSDDISLIMTIVVCLDEEVTSLHNRMHRYKE